MIIHKDFDKLKEILSDPEKAERLISYDGPTLELFNYKKVNIKNIANDKITCTYNHSRYHYLIEFHRTQDNFIKYVINTSKVGNYILIVITFILSLKNIFAAAFPIIIICVIYLVNNEIKNGIYNRINKRWDNF